MHVITLVRTWKRSACCLPSCSVSRRLVAAALNLNAMSFEPQLQRLMAVATVPTRQEDLSEYWGNTHTQTHTHSLPPHARTHMALGEIVRTTLTSLGSPPHLHPEDCGKLMCTVGNRKGKVGLIFFEGLVQSGAACRLLRNIPHPPAGSTRRGRTPLSGTSLRLEEKQSGGGG